MRTWGWIVAASALVLALFCGAAPARAENEALSGLLQYDQYNGVVGDGSGGFIVVGAQNTERPPKSVAKMRVFGAGGALLIDRTIRPRDAVSAALADVIRLADGDIVATGWIQRTGATSDNCWVIRAAPDGSVRWSTTTTGPAHERCYFVTALGDGAVLVGGRSEGDASGKAATVGAYWKVNAGTGALGAPVRSRVRPAGDALRVPGWTCLGRWQPRFRWLADRSGTRRLFGRRWPCGNTCEHRSTRSCRKDQQRHERRSNGRSPSIPGAGCAAFA